MLLISAFAYAQTNDTISEFGEERERITEIEEDSGDTPLEVVDDILLPTVQVEGVTERSVEEDRDSGSSSSDDRRKELYRISTTDDASSPYGDKDIENYSLEIATLDFKYGTFNYFETLLVFGRDLDIFNYFISLNSYLQDGIDDKDKSGYNVIPNSDYMVNDFKVDFNFNLDKKILGAFLSYYFKEESLMSNPEYISSKKRAVSLISKNEFFVLDNAGLTYIFDLDINELSYENISEKTSTYNYKIDNDIIFDYIWSEANYLFTDLYFNYTRNNIVDGTKQNLFLIGLEAKLGFRILYNLFLTVGGDLSYNSDSHFNIYPYALLRYDLLQNLSLFTSLEGVEEFQNFKDEYVVQDKNFIPTTMNAVSRNTFKIGLIYKPLDTMNINLNGVVGFSDRRYIPKTNDMYLYTYVIEDIVHYGLEFKFNYEIIKSLKTSFKLDLFAYPEEWHYLYLPMLDNEIGLEYMYERFDLSLKLALNNLVKQSAITGSNKFLYFVDFEAEKELFESLFIYLVAENIFDTREDLDIIYPSNGREFFLGVRIRL